MAWILFTLVFLSVLPFGAVEPWATCTLELTIFLLFAAALYRSFSRGTSFRFPLARTALLFLALHLVQLVPLPARLLESVSPTSYALVRILRPEVAPDSFGAISVAPWATLSSLIWFSCCLAAFWLAGLVAGRRGTGPVSALFGIPVRNQTQRTALALALTLGLAGTFQALYGLLEYALGWNRIFFYVRRYPMEGVAGTFINTNHCAAFLTLCLPILLSLALYLRHAGFRGSPAAAHRKTSGTAGRQYHRALALLPAAAALLVLLALAFTRSGGGIFSAAASLTFFYAVYLRQRGWRKSVNPTLTVLVVAVLCLLVIVILIPPDFSVSAVTEETRGDVVNRTTIITQSMTIVRDFPLFGSGAGTYAAMMLHYFQRMVVHAHNEHLELLCDLGPLGLLCSLLLIVIYLRTSIPVLFRRQRDRFRPGRFPMPLILPLGFSASLLGLIVHTVVDFPLRLPAIALAGACLLGVLISLLPGAGNTDGETERADTTEVHAGER